MSAASIVSSTASVTGGRLSLVERESLFHRIARAAVSPDSRACYVILSLLCAVTFGFGISTLPPTDRDESRFMQATKQMIETGDYVHIRVQEEPRHKKPIGIHWLQVVTVKAMGQPLNTPWPYRLPSAIAAWLAVLLVCNLGRYLFEARAGLIAGAVMATSPILIAEAHLAKTDAVLFACVTAAMASLARVHMSAAMPFPTARPHGAAAAFWLAVGAAILIKGPVVLMIVALTLATLCIVARNIAVLKAVQAWWGIPLAGAVVAPWIWALMAGGESTFISTAVKQDLLPKLIGGQEGHGAPPGSHLIASLLTTWPWSLLLPVGLIAAWRQRHEPAVRFCLAWLVPAWLAFEAIPTKLPHYTLPLLPAAALLLGAVAEPARLHPLFASMGGRVWRVVWAVLGLGLAGGVFAVARHYALDQVVNTDVWVLAAGTAAMAIIAAIAVTQRPPGRIVFAMAVFAAWFGATLIARVLPNLEHLWVSPRLAALTAHYPAPDEPVTIVGYREPSAVFLLGTKTRFTDAAGAVTVLLTHANARVAVERPALILVMDAVQATGRHVNVLGTVSGRNYARGADIELILLTAEPAATP